MLRPTRRSVLAGSLATLAAGHVLGDQVSPAAAPELPIAIDSKRQLFLDDYLIASMTGVTRSINPVTKHPANPILWPTEEWEDPMALLYGSVLRDGGQYRMWYMTGAGVAYAQSDDGVRWTKPAMDLVSVGGHKTNLLWKKRNVRAGPDAFPNYYELFGVHRDDRDPDPARRYKMGFLDIEWNHSGPGGDPFHRGQRRGLGVATSPDGIHWTLADPWATEAICDGATHWMFDPARQRYVLYGRTRKEPPEVAAAWSKYDWFAKWHSARAVARVESADFLKWDFTKPDTAPVVMTADLHDPPGTEIYSLKVFPYEGIYIGLVQVFHATPDDATLDVQLAVSRDGVRFTRVGDRRTPFIPLGGVGGWDRFNQSLANNDPIAVGDELRFYYAGRTYRHGPYSGPDKGPNRAGIGMASIPRDRFVALEASFDGGQIVTKPLMIKGQTLHINAVCRFGQILVELLDPAGRPIAKSKPITQDGLDIPVIWESDVREHLARPMVLRVSLKNARLFALWCG
ncbi:MAG TPA: hypothetical protein VH475_23505 [Tepidisphaeraceae bacterium]|jgi:hypothetical protein